MIDYNKEIVNALKPILPTHYEMVLHSGLNTPCYSYMEINNYSDTEVVNATLGYSRITYQVKVWSNRIEEIQKYALLADEALRKIGFKRISSGELYDHNSAMIQKILTYECLALENFN
jgi:hypothetical protein